MRPCAAWRFTCEDGRVASIRGNRDDTWSHGHICPKGATLGAVHEDPDRIRRPMIKVDGQWQEVSWDAAFRRCTELLAPVIEKYGIGAVTCYTGNPLAHSFSLGRYTGVLLGMSGIPLSYSPGTVDQWPKNLSSHLMYGGWWSFPVPDIERTDLLIVMGANPAASQGSLLAAPNVMGIIDSIRKRGKVIVVDPVRTATAARADEWLPITPGTDAALLLAVVHTLFAENLVRLGDVEPHLDGVDRMRQAAAEWSPERVAAVTGIAADRIRTLARELAGTERAVVYGRIGLCNQEFGSLASWLVDVVNILTGHFDTPGGSMFPRAAAWSVTVQPIPGSGGRCAGVRPVPHPCPRREGSPRAGARVVPGRGDRDAGGGADQGADHGRGQPRAVDARRPQARRGVADAGRDDLRRPVAQRNHQACRRDPARAVAAGAAAPRRPDPQLRDQQHRELLAAGVRAGGPGPAGGVGDPDPADRAVHRHARRGRRRRGHRRRVLRLHGVHSGARRRGPFASTTTAGGGPERILDFTLRTGPFGDRYGENPDGVTLDKLKAQPNGINFGPMVPQVPEILGTADHKIRLAPQYLLDDLPRLAERLDRAPDELVLVSRRHLRSNNSWLHNVGPLMKGKDRCTLLMHDDDATKRGVTTGDLVTVTSSGGQIEVPVEVTGEIMPGVVSMPHGWGHGKPGTRMAIANDSPGVNTNILSPPTFIDEPSGNGALNGIPVTVTPVAT